MSATIIETTTTNMASFEETLDEEHVCHLFSGYADDDRLNGQVVAHARCGHALKAPSVYDHLIVAFAGGSTCPSCGNAICPECLAQYERSPSRCVPLPW